MKEPEKSGFRRSKVGEQRNAFTRLDEIKSIVSRVFKAKPTQAWLDILEPAGIWCAPVLDWPAFVETGGFKALDILQTIAAASGSTAETTRCPIVIDGAKFTGRAAAPRLGADTDTYLNLSSPQ